MAVSPTPSPASSTEIRVPWPEVERFVALLTHDLRNGLNAVELQLTLLAEVSDDPAVKDEVKTVRASVADITRQLHAVRVATGTPTPHLFVYPAVDFVEDLRERFDRQHPDASARVEWRIEPGVHSLSIDPELSMAAMLELLLNALFFAAAPSPVVVHAGDHPDGMTLSIRQSSSSFPGATGDWGRTPLTSSRRDGYGLGTFRARRIIEAQKGTLSFGYAEEDRSLVATVVLPLAAEG